MNIFIWSVLVGLMTGLISGIIWLVSPQHARASFKLTFVVAFIIGAGIAAVVGIGLK